MYKLRDWIDETRLTRGLSKNVRAVEYLENNKMFILDMYICENENAIHIIEKCNISNYINYNKEMITFLRNNRKYIDYKILCGYAHGIEFIDECINNNELDKIHWRELSRNPAAKHILNNPNMYEMINWREIIENPNAGDLIRNNLDKVEEYWEYICGEGYLIDIIEENMDKIHWGALSKNYNAIHILKKNMDKIDICELKYNPNGFELLMLLENEIHNSFCYHKNIIYQYFDYCVKYNKPCNIINPLTCHGYSNAHFEYLKKNQDNINYSLLSKNPNIFVYDYNRMRETRQSLPWYVDIVK